MAKYKAVTKIILPRGCLSSFCQIEPEFGPDGDPYRYNHGKNDVSIPVGSILSWDGQQATVRTPGGKGITFSFSYPFLGDMFKSAFVAPYSPKDGPKVRKPAQRSEGWVEAYNERRRKENTRQRLVRMLKLLAKDPVIIREVLEVCELILLREEHS